MIIQPIDCNKGHRYMVRVRAPVGGEMEAPTIPGSITGLLARFTLTREGPEGAPDDPPEAIHPDLMDLPLVGDADEADLYYVDVSQAAHQAHLKPLGVGKIFYVVYSKDGVADFQADTFSVALGSNV